MNFNAGDLVSADTSQLLSDLINGSSLQLNVSSVVSQLNQSVTGISVDDLLTDLAQWRVMVRLKYVQMCMDKCGAMYTANVPMQTQTNV